MLLKLAVSEAPNRTGDRGQWLREPAKPEHRGLGLAHPPSGRAGRRRRRAAAARLPRPAAAAGRASLEAGSQRSRRQLS
jgi:hypothetical protein